MFKKIKPVLICSLGFAWIIMTFCKFSVFQSLGPLLTYSTGVFSLEAPGTAPLSFKTGYDSQIFVDNAGIPHIYGKDPRSCTFSMGYMQARDRSFQMEMITRTVDGSLSELVGKKAVKSDAFWLFYDLENKAKNILEEYRTRNNELYQMIVAYSDGINFYLQKEGRHDISPEYCLLDTHPRIWQPHYSILASWYMSYVLSYRNAHLSREALIQTLPADMLSSLYDYSDNCYSIRDSFGAAENSYSSSYIAGAVKSTALRTQEERVLSHGIGSNCWVVGKNKYTNGKTVLCNDTHLSLSLPSAWYETHLSCNEFNVYGFSVLGSPFIISGFNENVAWGITNAEWDMVDLVQLKVDKTYPGHYFYDGKWLPFTEKEYTVKTKGDQDTLIMLRSCPQGRVMEIDGKLYAERWHPGEYNNSLSVFSGFLRVKNAEEFQSGLKGYAYAPLNFLFSDKHGNIGMNAVGKIFLKNKGYSGGISTPGATVKYVNQKDLPKAYNPAEGYLFNANQRPARTGYYLNYEWTETFRAKRINEYLQAGTLLSLEAMKNLQNDRRDLLARELKILLEKYKKEKPAWTLVQPLSEWNFNMIPGKYEPLLFNNLSYFISEVFNEVLSKKYAVSEYPGIEKLVLFLKNNSSFTIGDSLIHTDALLEIAIDRCKQALVSKYGNNYKESLFKGNIEIPGIMRIPGTGAFVKNYGSSSNTVNMYSNAANGVSMRLIVEMGNSISAYTIQAGGQSGRWNSPKYKDQLDDWKNGKYRTAQFSRDSSSLTGIEQTINFYSDDSQN